jgi:hypothetical protein
VWSDFRRYRLASSAQKHLLWEALAALFVARLALACIPFRRIAAWLGTRGAESPATVAPQEIDTAETIGWAVGILARRVPWDGRCLVQALAASGMLRRRGLEGTVSFGAIQGDSVGFDAHAWLRVGSCVVTGGSTHESFRVFTTFARRLS